MGSITKSASAERTDLASVHQHCSERPYIELGIPPNASRVLAVTFSAVSRDQGWSDERIGTSFTYFSASVQRPPGKPSIRTLTIFENRPANPEFFEHTQRWTLNDRIRQRLWVEALEGGDVIQIIPKATYFGWVNIIQGATITIEYEVSLADHEPKNTSYHQLNTEHFATILNPKSREIRLLTLEPGRFNDPIVARFSIQSLADSGNEAPEFHALSYCWSTSTQITDINIGSLNSSSSSGTFGMPFRVTKSVEDALRRLRRPHRLFNIWVDSVCINQCDLKERAQQVSLMGDIYSRAKVVHIWLGENDCGIETCLRLVRNIFNFKHRDCPGGKACNCFGTPHSIELDAVDKKIKRKKGKSSFQGMHEVFELSERNFTREAKNLAARKGNPELQVLMPILFNHPWFSRVWVVQEAILSRRASVHCSGEVVPWREVFEVSELLVNPQFTRQREHIRSKISMAPIWKTLGHHRSRQHRMNRGSDGSEVDIPWPGILNACLQAVELKATDPRDKIFALFPFGDETNNLHELDPLIRPDYEKSVEIVFADFTRWWIKTHKSLAILSLIHAQPGRAWQSTSGPYPSGLHAISPSWSFRSEGQSKQAEATLESQFDFHATTQGQEPIVVDSLDPLSLRLLGRRVSRITAVGYPPAGSVYPYKQQRVKWQQMASVFDKVVDPCSSTGVWTGNTVPGRKGDNAARRAAEYEDHVKAHWAYFPLPKLTTLSIPDNSAQSRTGKTDKLPSCINKCFFLTSDGWFGLCPWTAQEGDIITLLAGANVPYLLRPAPNTDLKGEDYFTLVGECYTEGIMNGEVWSTGRNIGPLRVFHLV